MRKTSAWRLMSGGICWIATLEFFAAQAIAQAAWKGSDYSLADNAISDLGVTACGRITIAGQPGYYCSPLHGLMNASFEVTGILMLLGLYLTLPAWPGGRLARWGAALFTLAGIGKILVGLAPGNVNYGLHSLGGLGVIFANIGIILLGSAASGTNNRWISRLSVSLGILGLIGEVLFLAHRAFGGAGAAERVADYPVFAWMIVVGVCCVLWSRHPGSPEAELSGFSLIRSRTAVATPVPVADGVIITRAGTLLLSEAIPERGAAPRQAAGSRVPGDYAAIGRALAGLHQARGETFGLAEFDGFYGPLPQCNRPDDSGRWSGFYAERRVLPMLRLAVDSGYLPAGLARGVERVVAQLPALCGPDPVPALLHGDAQQNNFVSTVEGAVVVDVAPYFGHPEADLALVDIYSPVDPELFRAYAESAPLDPGFAGRCELWRLPGYLAAIAVAGANAFGRSFLPRLDAAIRQYT